MNFPFRPFGFLRFTPERFHVLLNSLSKCFSTFPHGTCSLSVSWSYLALDGVTTPLRAALSSNPTLRRDPPAIGSGHYGPGTLYGLWPRSRRTFDSPHDLGINGSSLTPQFRRPVSTAGFGAGLFPVRSQLLRESWLVSFPPLSNMLKFSGSLHLL
nr:unnamed protein product [Callosobruchus chinensis]